MGQLNIRELYTAMRIADEGTESVTIHRVLLQVVERDALTDIVDSIGTDQSKTRADKACTTESGSINTRVSP